MSSKHEQLIHEHVKLQREFMDYVHKNGFDYGAYSAPSPGSYYDTYRKREKEFREQDALLIKKH